MNRDQIREKIIADLSARGVPRPQLDPPAFRILWKLGLNVRHPLFFPTMAVAPIIGVMFTILWAGTMHFTVWEGDPLTRQILSAVVAGTIFTVAVGLLRRRSIKKFELPNWPAYLASITSSDKSGPSD